MSKNQSGFTLIEVLMVTVLLFFLSYTVFVSMRSTVSLKENIDERTLGLQSSRAVIGLMERDFQRAYYVRAADLGWDPQEAKPTNPGEEPPPPPGPPPSITIFQGEKNSVFFSTATHQRLSQDSPENEQHFVTYQLNQGKLIRAESPRAVSYTDREDPSKFREVELLQGVLKLEFEFYEAKQNRWESRWDSQGKDQLDRLPAAVRVYVEFEPETEKLREKIGAHQIYTAFRLTEDAYRNEIKKPRKKGEPTT